MPLARPYEAKDHPGPRVVRSSIGLTFLLPGVPQWYARQRERGLVLFATYASALAVGLFTWGTRTGLALMVFAYVTHVVSASDAIRQLAFPGFGRLVPTLSTSTCLGVLCYGPLLVVGTLFAWPGVEAGESNDSYLVNRLAYQELDPEVGEHVWLGPAEVGPGGQLAQVLAGPGEEVEWKEGQCRIGGRQVKLSPFRPGQTPKELAFKVPHDRYLISYRTNDPIVPTGWEVVPKSRFEGRAWARLYPVWERRLLP